MADFYDLHKRHEQTTKRAIITYMWGDFPTYKARFKGDCRDETDLSAFIEWIRGGYEDVQMGQVLVRTDAAFGA